MGPQQEAVPAAGGGDGPVEAAVALAAAWRDAAGDVDRHEARTAARLTALLEDPAGFAVATGFLDRVTRATGDRVAAEQLVDIVRSNGVPRFLEPVDKVLFGVGGRLAPLLPPVAMPLARLRLRQLVGHLVVDADPDALARRLAEARERGHRLNINLLGEAVLGAREAARRLERTIALVRRPDVDHVSVKITGIAAQLNPWAFEAELGRITDQLRELYLAAASTDPPTFVNLDLEEHRDLELSIAAFTRLLDEPQLREVEAGIVLQAYLPDSVGALDELIAWAHRRRDAGGAPVRIRLVKGANLAMERVEAELHGWPAAPYASKADTDANYKRLVDRALGRDVLGPVTVGIASHNLFDVAWALLLAEQRDVAEHVRVEMLQGMAPGEAAAVGRRTGELRLYTPVVAPDDFDVAISYLFRRLEETSAPDNFLRALPQLAHDGEVFAREADRFRDAVARRDQVPAAPYRTQDRRSEEPRVLDGFENEPDTDPSLPANRAWAADLVATPPAPLRTPVPSEVGVVDEVVVAVAAAQPAWHARGAAARRTVLHRVAAELSRRRGELVRVMVHEARKTVGEADPEVSEAIDFARYYAERAGELEAIEGLRHDPFGVVLVTPPWNFPVAIPAGGVLAALAAGNGVVFKPAPETRRCAELVAEACWAAGVPDDVLRFLPCDDDEVGRALVSHRGLGAIVLTGAAETAARFRSWNPDVPLFAETSGKNALVISPAADLDLAVADLVRSAFGHAGQKCSAASLAICIGELADEPRFVDQLVDAVESLAVGPSTDLTTTMGPLIHPPEEKLRRALTSLEPGERWLIEPRQLSEDGSLWSPGVRVGVRPGSWTHTTEWFGPVLGIVRAADLDEAIAIQNATGYGLTGGIHTLDDREVERWLARVQVGNAYVNRHITGAIVQRQPFGGWKRSSVGPGAKAGGPHYVAQLGTWHEEGPPAAGLEPAHAVQDLVGDLFGAGATAPPGLSADDVAWLETAARSDELAWRAIYGVEHDPSGLRAEANVLRYRPRRLVVVRVGTHVRHRDVVRVVLAAVRAGVPVQLSTSAPGRWRWLDVEEVVESPADLVARVTGEEGVRVRVVGRVDDDLLAAAVDLTVDVVDGPVVAHGEVELHHHLLEQAVSRTRHRYGVVRDDR
jgi:RHH-type transcriptional regulator, proline utilization regulon repressor / proline dehydrogenase / delta 1-pyrroline-5-carboxylate dehydrogenase